MVIEGESQGLERAYGNKGLFFADRADFLNNADAYLCYSPQNPRRFLFVRQLDQTRNWYIFLLTTAVAVTSLFYALFGKG